MTFDMPPPDTEKMKVEDAMVLLQDLMERSAAAVNFYLHDLSKNPKYESQEDAIAQVAVEFAKIKGLDTPSAISLARACWRHIVGEDLLNELENFMLSGLAEDEDGEENDTQLLTCEE